MKIIEINGRDYCRIDDETEIRVGSWACHHVCPCRSACTNPGKGAVE